MKTKVNRQKTVYYDKKKDLEYQYHKQQKVSCSHLVCRRKWILPLLELLLQIKNQTNNKENKYSREKVWWETRIKSSSSLNEINNENTQAKQIRATIRTNKQK